MQIALPEPTVEERQGDIPEATALYAPHPNPFNPSVRLSYSLSVPSAVHLKVYDVRGRLIRTLVSGPETAGRDSMVWNGDDDQGRQVASGVYFARFEGAGVVQTHRMVLLK